MGLTIKSLVWYIYSNDKAKDAIFYSYNKNINGFAAILEEEEAAEIASEEFDFMFPIFLFFKFLAFMTSVTSFSILNRASKCFISFLEQGKKTAHNLVMEFP